MREQARGERRHVRRALAEQAFVQLRVSSESMYVACPASDSEGSGRPASELQPAVAQLPAVGDALQQPALELHVVAVGFSIRTAWR